MKNFLICTALLLSISIPAIAENGLITVESQHSVSETAKRFEAILAEKGLNNFLRVNHTKNAESVGHSLLPTELIIFGNPKVGTPLMNCSQTIAIDLPQKALFWQDQHGKNWMSYNDPIYLKERHVINGCEKVITKITNVLKKLTQLATKKEEIKH